ncbi:MAG: hypothetical protein KIT44_06525 [Opitutaceae bacterium]|nr:hypothetical protein [Opitutaceae bacterium]
MSTPDGMSTPDNLLTLKNLISNARHESERLHRELHLARQRIAALEHVAHLQHKALGMEELARYTRTNGHRQWTNIPGEWLYRGGAIFSGNFNEVEQATAAYQKLFPPQ